MSDSGCVQNGRKPWKTAAVNGRGRSVNCVNEREKFGICLKHGVFAVFLRCKTKLGQSQQSSSWWGCQQRDRCKVIKNDEVAPGCFGSNDENSLPWNMLCGRDMRPQGGGHSEVV